MQISCDNLQDTVDHELCESDCEHHDAQIVKCSEISTHTG